MQGRAKLPARVAALMAMQRAGLKPYLPVASVVAVGILFSLIGFFQTRGALHDEFAAQFKAVAAEPINAVERQINSDVGTVESLAAFFDSSLFVERDEFHVFAGYLLDLHPSIKALEWLPHVKASEREDYERRARVDGYPSFKITERSAEGDLVPASPRDTYTPVYYVEPYNGNEKALGFDVASEPIRRQALHKSQETGKLTATRAISLVQKPSDLVGFLAVLPIFSRQRSTKAFDQNPLALTGYVLGVFSVSDIVDAALSGLTQRRDAISQALQLHVYELNDDSEGSARETLLYARQISTAINTGYDDKPSEIRSEEQIRFADHRWKIVVSATDLSIGSHYTWLPWMVLLAGLGATGIAAPIYQARQRGLRQLNELAQSLNEKNAILERVSAMLAAHVPSQVCETIFSGRYDPSIKAKRKKLTIVFADIIDFTDLTSDLEPEDLTFLLNDYFTDMSVIAAAHGATIDKFIGDAMLMFFGDPESKGVEKDALAGVSMAVAMQIRMGELRRRWREKGYLRSFHMRIGINTGYANVGNFGSTSRLEYTIIGNEVNKAARLQEAAKPDSIALTGETYALVKAYFHASVGEPLWLKGFSREIRPYYVLDNAHRPNGDQRIVRFKNGAMKVVVDPARIDPSAREKCLTQLEEIASLIRNKAH